MNEMFSQGGKGSTGILTKTHRIQVFSETGTHLGYLAVYSS